MSALAAELFALAGWREKNEAKTQEVPPRRGCRCSRPLHLIHLPLVLRRSLPSRTGRGRTRDADSRLCRVGIGDQPPIPCEIFCVRGGDCDQPAPLWLAGLTPLRGKREKAIRRPDLDLHVRSVRSYLHPDARRPRLHPGRELPAAAYH